MIYRIRAGTTIWREGAVGVEQIKTSKEVTYEEKDKIGDTQMMGMKLYRFNIPWPAGAPYRNIFVRQDDVDAFPDINDIEQGYIDFPP